MHIGSYDNELVTIAAMEQYAVNNGYIIDFSDNPPTPRKLPLRPTQDCVGEAENGYTTSDKELRT